MPRIPIDDLDDPRIAVYRSLKVTNRTRDLGQFVVEGERLVERLIDSRFPVVSLLIADRFEGKLTRPIAEGVPAYIVPHGMVDQVVGFPFHRGILACGQRRPWPALETLVAGAERPFFAVICPKLSNPENLGALARIGDVFGIDAILAGPECPDPLSRRVLRVSMGAALRLPVIIEDRLINAAARLVGSAGLELIAAVADAQRDAVRGRSPAATARAGPRRRARGHRRRLAGAVPSRRHDPDAAWRQLAQRRCGRGDLDLSLFEVKPAPGPTYGPGSRRSSHPLEIGRSGYFSASEPGSGSSNRSSPRNGSPIISWYFVSCSSVRSSRRRSLQMA